MPSLIILKSPNLASEGRSKRHHTGSEWRAAKPGVLADGCPWHMFREQDTC